MTYGLCVNGLTSKNWSVMLGFLRKCNDEQLLRLSVYVSQELVTRKEIKAKLEE